MLLLRIASLLLCVLALVGSIHLAQLAGWVEWSPLFCGGLVCLLYNLLIWRLYIVGAKMEREHNDG